MSYTKSAARAFAGNLITTFASCRKGNVALLFAILTPVLIGGAGLATEAGLWYHRRLELQSAADAAAYAAAVDLRAGATQAAFTQEATSAAQSGGFDPGLGTITVNWPPQSGSHQTNQAIEVLISERVPRFFTTIFTTAPLIEHARSVTTFQTASNACVLALNTSASGAANFQGSTTLNLTSCSVMSNSLSSSAISVQGSATLNTECLIAVGGISCVARMTRTKSPVQRKL